MPPSAPKTIADFNGLYLGTTLTAGQSIKIPLTQNNFEQKANTSTNFLVLLPLNVSRADDQSLNTISRLYNVPVNLINEWNGIETENNTAGNIVVGYLKVRKDQIAFLDKQPAKQIVKPVESKPATDKPIVSIPDIKPPVEDVSNADSDKLFQLARKAAFDKKNYSLAIELCKKALDKSPGYADIRIFLGRIYTWNDQLDSARQSFERVIEKDPGYADVYVAYADLEYWNDQPEKALQLTNKGLQLNPESTELLLRKAKILNNLKRPKEAIDVIEKLLKLDPKNTEGRLLASRLKDAVAKNKIGVGYDYTTFDKQFSDPWHIVSLDYTRQTKIGSVGAHINYANRFKRSGVQYEMDAYPSLGKNFYGYIGAAYSSDVGIFPKYRGGFSIYASLPKSFEAEGGIRYLYFSDATLIYTASLSKYYKSWLFTARTYLTPGETKISQSYNATARYYFGGADDFIGLTLGTGISPDETPASILLNSNYKLITQKASLAYRHSFKKKHIVSLSAGWVKQEYLPKTRGTQLEAGLAYQIRF